jgi:two-component system KDP operon response regulator KdpE
VSEGAAPELSILLVVRDAQVTKLLRASFVRQGFAVVQCSSGHKGLNVLAVSTPDLVVCDEDLADMGGLSLYAQIQQHFPQVRVLLMLSDPLGAERIPEFEVLLKPFTLDELIRMIRRTIPCHDPE